MLGEAATPVALFTLGAVPGRASHRAHHRAALRTCPLPGLVKLQRQPQLARRAWATGVLPGG